MNSQSLDPSFAQRGKSRRIGTSLAVALLFLGVNSASSAETYVAVGGGALVPWEGDTGYSLVGELGTTVFTKHIRLNLEFEYEKYDVDVGLSGYSLPDASLHVRNYDLRTVVRFVFFPKSLSPYVGVGAGINLIEIDDRDIKTALGIPALTGSNPKSYGFSFGLVALAGVEAPVFTNRLRLYAEARTSVDWELSDPVVSTLTNANFGNFTAMAGLRVFF